MVYWVVTAVGDSFRVVGNGCMDDGDGCCLSLSRLGCCCSVDWCIMARVRIFLVVAVYVAAVFLVAVGVLVIVGSR